MGRAIKRGAQAASGPLEPMLAREYDAERPPGFLLQQARAQPKLDGVRMLARLRELPGGQLELELHTRSGKALDHLRPAFEASLRALLSRPDARGVTLDGELYAHGAGFQAIVSAARNVGKAAAAGGAQLQVAPGKPLRYHVYDLYDEGAPGAPFLERHARLEALVRAGGGAWPAVALVPTVALGGAEEAVELHDAYVAGGYEGAILRDAAGPYEPGRRSPGLIKLKRFQDAEFRIVGWVEATGKDAGTVVFECETKPGGARFRVRPQGSREDRARMLRDAPGLLGRPLTVRFQGRTLDGLPRFPVGVAVRDYE